MPTEQSLSERIALHRRPRRRLDIERLRDDETAAARHRSLLDTVKRALRPWGQPDRVVCVLAAASFLVPGDAAAADLGTLPDALILATSIAVLALGIVIGWCIAWVQVWLAARDADRESEAAIRRLIALQAQHDQYIRDKFEGESA